MINTFELKEIKELYKLNKKFPSFLNKNTETLFKTQINALGTELAKTGTCKIGELGNIENTRFITSLFCHFVKLKKSYNLYYIEIDSYIEDVYQIETEDEKSLFIFFKVPNNQFSNTEESISGEDPEDILTYMKWLDTEIRQNKGIKGVKEKYTSVTNMLEEMREGESEDLPDEFYDELEIMKSSISESLNSDLIINNLQLESDKIMEKLGELLSDQETKEVMVEEVLSGEEEQPNTIITDWLGSKVTINNNINIGEALVNEKISIECLDNKNGWLACQKTDIKETIVALWVDYLINKDPNELGTWENFSNSLKEWLRLDCSTDIKKIEKKIRSTLDRILYSGFIESLCFIRNNSDFVKICLFIEEMAAKETGKISIISVENVQQQYFYSLDNDLTLSLIWGAIIHNKLNKTLASKTIKSQFESLKDKFPNFKEVIDYYSGAMFIYEQTGTVPAPVLLLGSPGLGKTHFANEIAKVIGSQMTVIPISSLSAGWIITGAASQWKDAQMGKVASSLLNGNTCSPVIVLDEIDKKSEGNYNPIGGLYPLLEYQTAKDFVDEYLEFPINASNVLWVATANNLTTIDEPILDRFVVFEIKKLSQEDTIKVAKSIYSEITNGVISETLSKEILEELKDKTPRQIKQILKKGLAYAAATREPNIVLKTNHLDLKGKIRKIGF